MVFSIVDTIQTNEILTEKGNIYYLNVARANEYHNRYRL